MSRTGILWSRVKKIRRYSLDFLILVQISLGIGKLFGARVGDAPILLFLIILVWFTYREIPSLLDRYFQLSTFKQRNIRLGIVFYTFATFFLFLISHEQGYYYTITPKVFQGMAINFSSLIFGVLFLFFTGFFFFSWCLLGHPPQGERGIRKASDPLKIYRPISKNIMNFKEDIRLIREDNVERFLFRRVWSGVVPSSICVFLAASYLAMMLSEALIILFLAGWILLRVYKREAKSLQIISETAADLKSKISHEGFIKTGLTMNKGIANWVLISFYFLASGFIFAASHVTAILLVQWYPLLLIAQIGRRTSFRLRLWKGEKTNLRKVPALPKYNEIILSLIIVYQILIGYSYYAESPYFGEIFLFLIPLNITALFSTVSFFRNPSSTSDNDLKHDEYRLIALCLSISLLITLATKAELNVSVPLFGILAGIYILSFYEDVCLHLEKKTVKPATYALVSSFYLMIVAALLLGATIIGFPELESTIFGIWILISMLLVLNVVLIYRERNIKNKLRTSS